MKRRFERGFTLVELIVVLLIIAILAAISIPTFRNYLEKSLETTDLIYVRDAYTDILADSILGEEKPEKLERQVPLKQKQDDFQFIVNPSVGGITKDNNKQWIGSPHAGETCRVYYDIKEKVVIIDWSGDRRPMSNVGTEVNSWEGRKADTHTGRPDRLGSEKLVLLKSGKTYQATFRWPSNLTKEEQECLDKYNIGVGTLLFEKEDGYGKPHHDSGWKNEWQTIGKEKTLTIKDIKTDKAENNYLGINLKVTNKKTRKDYNFKDPNSTDNESKEHAETLERILKRVLQNVEVEETK